GFAHTIWLPLEPVSLSNGPLAVVPWPRGKVVSPSELGVEEPAEPADGSRRPHVAYHAALQAYLRRHAPDWVVPQLDPGDMVVFASTTPHGTLPFQSPARAAMQVLVRPSNLRWARGPNLPRECQAVRRTRGASSKRWAGVGALFRTSGNPIENLVSAATNKTAMPEISTNMIGRRQVLSFVSFLLYAAPALIAVHEH